jgi:DNA-binding NtrC family response regulator
MQPCEEWFGGVRPRLLVVEDSFPAAEALKVLLEGLGFAVVGMAGTIEKALHLVHTLDFELAILDIALHGETVAAVVSAVQQRGKAAIFLSGYSNVDMLPSHLRGYPRLEKPVDPDVLVVVLRELLQQESVGTSCGDRTAGDATSGRSSKDW